MMSYMHQLLCKMNLPLVIYWVSQYFICMDFIQQLGEKNTENLI